MAAVIDADAHVLEGAPFALAALERWPDHVAVRADGKLGLAIEGRNYPEPDGPGAGCPPEHGAKQAPGIDPNSIEGVLADARTEGVDVRVLFPSLGLGAATFTDPDFAAEFARYYNEWIAAYCAQAPGVLHAAAVVPIEDVKTSAAMVAEAKALGLVAMLVPPGLRDRNLDHPDLEPFFAACEDAGLPVCVHGAPGMHMPKIGVDRFTNYIQVHCISFPFDMMTAMTAIVSGGVLERHPRLRVGFLEAGATWLPYFVHRLHEHYEKRGDWIAGGWARDPREYVERGQVWLTCEAEEPLLGAVAREYPDCLMWASDYPHWDADWPHAARTMQGRDDVDEALLAKLMGANAARFYQLPA